MTLVYTQQTEKMVHPALSPAASGAVFQGQSVAISNDGLVAVSGAPGANQVAIFEWSTVTNEWVPSQVIDSLDGGLFGNAVAISDDGNTILVSAEAAQSAYGSAYVYFRASSTWDLEQELFPGDIALPTPPLTQAAHYGYQLDLSGDGNTAVVGGPRDSATASDVAPGAAWVWSRSAGVWTNDDKLVTGGNEQGRRVAISADGSTIAISGATTADADAAMCVFVNSGTWDLVQTFGEEEHGAPTFSSDATTLLVQVSQTVNVYTGIPGSYIQTDSFSPSDIDTAFESFPGLALSDDGTVAVVGNAFDNDRLGAFWVFSDQGSGWEQQGGKLTPLDWDTDPNGDDPAIVEFGYALDISGDGRYVIVGAPYNDNVGESPFIPPDVGIGAAWVFTNELGTGASSLHLTALITTSGRSSVTLTISARAHFPRT